MTALYVAAVVVVICLLWHALDRLSTKQTEAFLAAVMVMWLVLVAVDIFRLGQHREEHRRDQARIEALVPALERIADAIIRATREDQEIDRRGWSLE